MSYHTNTHILTISFCRTFFKLHKYCIYSARWVFILRDTCKETISLSVITANCIRCNYYVAAVVNHSGSEFTPSEQWYLVVLHYLHVIFSYILNHKCTRIGRTSCVEVVLYKTSLTLVRTCYYRYKLIIFTSVWTYRHVLDSSPTIIGSKDLARKACLFIFSGTYNEQEDQLIYYRPVNINVITTIMYIFQLHDTLPDTLHKRLDLIIST